MITSFHGKNLITLQDWSKQEIETVLDVSYDLKRKFAQGIRTPYLQDQTVFLMFFNTSTRTRNSMEAGITQLGGHAHYLDSHGMQVSHGESAKDTAIILSSYGHCIACRCCQWDVGNKYVEEMAKWSRVPVINMQSDLYHPLQGLADLMTIDEHFKCTDNLNVSIIWTFATTHKKPISVPVSQCLLFPRFGMNVTLAYPKGYELPDWVIEQARKNAEENHGTFRITNDIEDAFTNADVVFPKNWGNWVADQSTDAISDALMANKSWKCTEKMMSLTNPGSVYMHALPADRQNEVEDAVIDGPHSIVYAEAENRLHTSKAIMDLIMGGRA